MAQRVHMSEFWYLYGQTFRLMGRITLWIPLLLQGILALALLLMHYYIFAPVTGSIIASLAGMVNSEYAPMLYHYPAHLALLPYFYGILRLILSVLTEAFLFGIVIDMLIAIYRGQRPAFMQSLSSALKRYLQLTFVWLILIGVLFLLDSYFSVFVEDVLGFSLQDAPRRQMMVQMTSRGMTILVYSTCVFLLPSIMTGGASFWEAIKRGFKVFGRHPFVAIGLILIPYLIGFLPSWVLSDPTKIVNNFYPELVLYLLLVSIAVDVIVNFILLGTSLKFFMDQST